MEASWGSRSIADGDGLGGERVSSRELRHVQAVAWGRCLAAPSTGNTATARQASVRNVSDLRLRVSRARPFRARSAESMMAYVTSGRSRRRQYVDAGSDVSGRKWLSRCSGRRLAGRLGRRVWAGQLPVRPSTSASIKARNRPANNWTIRVRSTPTSPRSSRVSPSARSKPSSIYFFEGANLNPEAPTRASRSVLSSPVSALR
jgi:hypothetical protein